MKTKTLPIKWIPVHVIRRSYGIIQVIDGNQSAALEDTTALSDPDTVQQETIQNVIYIDTSFYDVRSSKSLFVDSGHFLRVQKIS